MIKRCVCILILLTTGLPKLLIAQENISDEKIKLVIQQFAEDKKIPSIVVGLIDKNGNRIICFGKLNNNENNLADGNTLYEIGSITKVFTSILLQNMADNNELDVNDPISKYLPASVKAPAKDGKEITLLDLSSQVSGLPRMPSNFRPSDFSNPFADYIPEKLYEFLSTYKLTRGIGETYEYSNVGVGLLGHILELIGKSNYESLVIKNICAPLNMSSTVITITPELKKRLATGYNEKGIPVKNWDFSALAGAGALKSSVNDLLVFLEANLGVTKTKLLPVMEKTHQAKHETSVQDLDIAMGWHIWKKFGKKITWHNGGTFGYRTFIGFDKENKKGVVVLSNSAAGVDDLGLYLLEDKYGLKSK